MTGVAAQLCWVVNLCSDCASALISSRNPQPRRGELPYMW
jgi:hypothetical protein